MRPSQLRLTGDQAVALRQLARDARSHADVEPEARSGRMVVVCGAKGGVGASTLSLRLAEALSSHDRTLLIDANLRQGDLAHIAGATGGGRDLADVLAGLCHSDDAVVSLRENLQLLPGAWAPAVQPEATSESVGRWLEELNRAVTAGDTLVIDAGVGMKPWTEPLWRAATQVVLITTPNRVSVLDAYATTKLARGEAVKTPVQLLVNRAHSQSQAKQVHRSVNSTCQRFLGETLALLGWAPDDDQFAAPTVVDDDAQVAEEWLSQLLAPDARRSAA